jgi:hypothetical protein
MKDTSNKYISTFFQWVHTQCHTYVEMWEKHMHNKTEYYGWKKQQKTGAACMSALPHGMNIQHVSIS